MTTIIFKRKLGALLLAASFGAAVAAPTGQQVVAGQATFSQQGNVFSITNTPGTIINWQGFSINQGEITRFIQQSADSAVLNRIVGQDPSRILGALQSNGKVFLINPNGILFGRDSRVDVNALVASSLNISNADFLAGKKNFQAGAIAGAVRNEGAIKTPTGGQVFLVAPNVSNAGIITSPKGEVVLAAGHSVQLVDSRDPDLQVVVAAPNDQAINLGQVVAQGGSIGIYGALVSQRGVVNANSAVVGENGKIVFKASRATQLEAGSVTSATGAGTGGEIHLLGDSVALNGNAAVNASGRAGGGTVLVGGDWQGKNAALPNASRTFMGKDASIKADALASGDGGKVVLWSNESTSAHGSISAQGGSNGGNGGKVETSGHSLDVAGIKVRAGAAKGKAGDWLLDPYDIEVITGGTTALGDVADATSGPATGVAQVAPSDLTHTGANIQLAAQHDITVTDALSAAGNVTASAGHDLNINADVATSGGNITLHAVNAINLAAAAHLKSSNYVDLIADQMTLAGSIGSAGGQLPTITFNPSTDSRPIQVGGTAAESALWLDPAALSRFSAYGINMGSSVHTGGITVLGALSQAGNVIMDTGGAISIQAPITAGTNASVIASQYGNQGYLLDVLSDITAGKLVQLKGDALRIAGSVTAPDVVLAPNNAGTAISLGVLQPEAAFSLDEAMLKKVNATNLTIGGQPGQVGATQIGGAIDLTSHPFGKLTIDSGAPELSVDAPFTMPSGVLALKGGNLYETSGGGLKVDQLALTSTGQLRLEGTNQIGTIAATAGDRVVINTTGALRVGQVDGLSGLGTSNSGLSVSTDGLLTLGANVSIGHDELLLSAGGITGSGVLTGNTVHLESTNGIGSANAPVNTVASTLMLYNAQAGSSPINVSNTGDVNLVAMMQKDVDGGTNGGSLTLHNSGNLSTNTSSVDWWRVRTGAGNIDLSASGTMNINGSVSSDSGNISLVSGGDMTVAGAVASNSGNLNLTAANGSRFTVLSGASVASTSGDINVSAGSTAIANGTVTGAPGKVHLPDTAPPPPPPPPLDECAATPGLSGCGAVLAAARTACAADWNAGFCDQVMPAAIVAAHKALLACAADPQGPDCGAILPSVESCQKSGGQLGCDAVLAQRARLDACLGHPSDAGCDGILPTWEQCQAKAGVYGCGPATAQHDKVQACLNDATAACFDTVLPKYEACQAAPATFGCSVVTKRHDDVATCLANPTASCFASTLPQYEACQAAPSTFGCSVVTKRHDDVASCMANPTASCFASTLPQYAACQASPSTFGCAVVTKRHDDITACIASPNGAACATVLPASAACHADASVYGCAPVLAREQFLLCVADPSSASCDAILPSLNVCKLTPSTEGCAAVIGKTFNFCLGSPHDARCLGVLPDLSQCVANKSINGCQAVLPTLLQCVGSPTLQGCQVVLPSLASCAASPSTAGCEAVLPKPDFCTTHPSDPSCQVFSPNPGGGTSDGKAAPVVQIVQTTVTLVNAGTVKVPGASTGSTAGSGSPGGGGGSTSSNPGTSTSSNPGSGSDSNSGTDKKTDKQSGPSASENSGAKNEKPATKTYCN